MAGNMLSVTDSTWDAEIGQYQGHALVDFWAEWCGPCIMLAPIVEQLAGENSGKLKVAKLDVDENSDVAGRYAIRSIPCLILFQNGQELDRVVGLRSKAELKAWLDGKMKA
jgi:thioredoxin 1